MSNMYVVLNTCQILSIDYLPESSQDDFTDEKIKLGQDAPLVSGRGRF